MADENNLWEGGAGSSNDQQPHNAEQVANDSAADANAKQNANTEQTVNIDPVENTAPLGEPVATETNQPVPAASDAPDYGSAKGEQTVVSSAPANASTPANTTNAATPQEASTQQYRPAPEFGVYGPVPTQPVNNGQPQQPAAAQSQQQNAPTSFFGFGRSARNDSQQGDRNPYANMGGNGNLFLNPNGQQPQNGAAPVNTPAGAQNAQGAGVPGAMNNPANPVNSGNGAVPPQQGVPGMPQPGAPRKGASAAAKSVVAAVIAAVVSAALCLGLGYAAITNGWVKVPTTSSLSSVTSNKSGSGSATAKTGEAPDWTAVANSVSNSVVSIQTVVANGSAKGSGAIISKDGHIVTNNHVISGAQQIQVTLANGQIYSASIVGSDTTTDLAVIKLDNPPSDLTAVEFADSDKLAVGESVMAIGNPLGYDDTATTGIVSALNRPVSVMDDESNQIVTNAVQIDAAINPGNSGGPTFNAAGQVIGINSSIASTASSSSSAGSIGIGFAIPSNLIKRVANEIMSNGKVAHVALGVTIKSATVEADGVTRGAAQITSSSTGSGVISGGPADKAGLKVGDSIVAFNGNAVNNNYSLLGFVRAAALGDKVTLTIVRDGSTMDVDVTLDQEEEAVTGSNKSESNGQNGQNNQNGNGQDSQNGQNGQNGDGQDSQGGNGYDDGGFMDPFGLW